MGLNHARVLATHPRTSLDCVVERDEGVGRSVAHRYGTRWTPELGDLRGFDAIVIAAATESHFDLAMQVILDGLPLLVEKPVCPSLGQTTEVVAASRLKGTPLQVGLLERFNPAFVAAQRIVEAPCLVRTERHSPYTPRIRTGVAWDLLVHDVDLISRLFGGASPNRQEATVGFLHPASLPDAEDVVEAVFAYGGGLASASASRIGQRKVRTMVIQELDRMIEVDLLRRGVTIYRHATIEGEPGHGGYRQRTEIEVPDVIGIEPLAAQLDHFVSLLDGTYDADTERDSVLPAHSMVDAVLQAGRANRGGEPHSACVSE